MVVFGFVNGRSKNWDYTYRMAEMKILLNLKTYSIRASRAVFQ